ncbi:MAG: hypothetical protein KGL39_14450 [Patescibacteria group bacterium]|nr:hypothetical protein [Patescibacteria group bacterium]
MIPTNESLYSAINPVTGKTPSGLSPLGELLAGGLPTPQEMGAMPAQLDIQYGAPPPLPPLSQNTINLAEYSGTPGAIGLGNFTANDLHSLAVSAQPIYDPNYPAESMLAERNYLTSQADKSVPAAENARGLSGSGVTQYAEQKLNDYIDTIAPYENPSQAFLQDLSRYVDMNQYIPGPLLGGSGGSFPRVGIPEYLGTPPAGDPAYIVIGGSQRLGNSQYNGPSKIWDTPGYFYNPTGQPTQQTQIPTAPAPTPAPPINGGHGAAPGPGWYWQNGAWNPPAGVA